MKLTEEEREIILAKRREEENNKPKKVGFLKHDLFFIKSYHTERLFRFTITRFIQESKGWWFEKRTIQDVIKEIEKEMFELKAPAGTKFVCYIDIDNDEEIWFDDNGIGLEEMDSDWAAQHLENIQPYKSNSLKKKKIS